MTSVLSALLGVNEIVVTAMPSLVGCGGAEHAPQPFPMVLEVPSTVPQSDQSSKGYLFMLVPPGKGQELGFWSGDPACTRSQQVFGQGHTAQPAATHSPVRQTTPHTPVSVLLATCLTAPLLVAFWRFVSTSVTVTKMGAVRQPAWYRAL